MSVSAFELFGWFSVSSQLKHYLCLVQTSSMENFKKSSGDLMSSGKLVAESAMSAFQEKSVENVDKKKVAGASAEILDSASAYAKLEDKPVGQYMEKAEVYLKQYSAGGTEEKPTDAAAPPAAAVDAPPKPEAEEEAPKEPAPKPEAEESGGGLFKMAQGFMK